MKKLFISCPMKDRTEAQIRGTMMQIQRISHPDNCSFFERGKARIDGDNAGESRTIRRWTKRRHVLWYGGCLRCISYPDDRYRAEYCPM